MDIAVKNEGQAKLYIGGRSHPAISNQRTDSTTPNQKREASTYVDLNPSRNREKKARNDSCDRIENPSQAQDERRPAEQVKQEAEREERPSNAEVTQLMTEASDAIEQMSQRLEVAYEIGERLIKERNEERTKAEEWKTRATIAESNTMYWSNGNAELSSKIREEQRKRNNTGRASPIRESQAGNAITIHDTGNDHEASPRKGESNPKWSNKELSQTRNGSTPSPQLSLTTSSD